MDQNATWYGSRPRTMVHCVRWGPSSPHGNGHSSPPHFSAHVYCGQTVAHLSYCWAVVWTVKRSGIYLSEFFLLLFAVIRSHDQLIRVVILVRVRWYLPSRLSSYRLKFVVAGYHTSTFSQKRVSALTPSNGWRDRKCIWACANYLQPRVLFWIKWTGRKPKRNR